MIFSLLNLVCNYCEVLINDFCDSHYTNRCFGVISKFLDDVRVYLGGESFFLKRVVKLGKILVKIYVV